MAAVMSASMLPLDASAGETLVLSGGGQRKNPPGYEGYSYELWIDNTGGSGNMTLNDEGAFDTEWNCSCSRGNFLARRGMDFGEKDKATSIGTITLDYAASYSQTGQYNGGGNSRLCVYGWMSDPLAEYYIIEDWINWCPGPDPSVCPAKTVTIDDAEYDIFWIWHEGPTIKSSYDRFKQYFSIRKTKRTSGKITVSEHFKAWENAGMEIGKLYEVALNVEGWQSSGKANVTKNVVTVGGSPVIVDPPTPTPTGYLMKDSFENGVGNWTSRGGTTITSSSTGASGKGVSVTGRTSSWNGVSTNLSTSTYKPGTAYSFSVMAMQNAASSDTMKLTLQYNLNGTANYSNIAEVKASKGEWVQLANTSYTIPSGASDLVLYVEADSTSNSFFIDEATIAAKGTKIAPAGSAADVLLGDVNCDGVVNMYDLVALKQSLRGANTFIRNEAADLNKDSKIDDSDAELIREIVLYKKIITVIETPPEEIPEEKPVRKDGYYYNLADVSWIDPSKPMVAFAFDDGPIGGSDAYNVTRIHNALSQNGAHATFFYWGERIAGNENEIKRAKELGFEIANHTWTHTDLTSLDANGIKSEIGKCAAKLKELTGQEDFLVRPPYLGVNYNVQQNCGVALVNCGIDSGDWQTNTTEQQIKDKFIQAAQNGSLNGQVLLMHENYGKTAGAVEYLVPELIKRGYQIVSVGEMFKAKGIDMQYGQVYNKLP
jgi:peptidoglycan/xylan/chitin deacetylase (PgdA/CDA1 family)